uniref:Uncharacterized protein n=1 Tax=Meloidogyne hapla TaxID=6305 RepID=A0A1I8BXH1_MELHA
MHSLYLACVLLFVMFYEIDCVKPRGGKKNSGRQGNREFLQTEQQLTTIRNYLQQLNEQSASISNLSLEPQKPPGVVSVSARELRARRRSRNEGGINPGTSSLHGENSQQEFGQIGGSGHAISEFHEDEPQHNQELNIGEGHQIEHGESSRGTEGFSIRNIHQNISGPHQLNRYKEYVKFYCKK